MQLKILSLEERDFGKYYCRARNKLGSDSDVAILSGKQISIKLCKTIK